MPTLTVAFFGDIVGAAGIRAFAHAAEAARRERGAQVVLVNGENAKAGSGITPDAYKEIRRAGADGISLGDHCFKDRRIADILDDPARPIARPANLAPAARGKKAVVITPAATHAELSDPGARTPEPLDPATPPLALITVLGRIFMPMPANDPFEAVDREVAALLAADPRTAFIIEVHAEATSEKQAVAWHCLRKWPQRVVAVVGTHTHVQTADARIIDGAVAAISDLGMCGGHRSILGRKVAPVLETMTTQNPLPYDVSEEEPRATGCLLRIDMHSRVPLSIEPLSFEPPGATG